LRFDGRGTKNKFDSTSNLRYLIDIIKNSRRANQ
jgi:hypothetical protein